MQHPKLKKIAGLITAVFTALICMTAALPAVNAGSVYEEYVEWSQLDPRWANTNMDGTTIRSSGCLITSTAMLAVHSGSIDAAALKNLNISSIEEFNPAVLVDAYTRFNGFYSEGCMRWATIHEVIPNMQFIKDDYFKSVEKNAVINEIKNLQAEGYHIIARVAAPYGAFHWVLITSVDGEHIYMCDPAKDEHEVYEAYPDGLQGEYWALKGAKAPMQCKVDFTKFEPEINLEVAVSPEKTVYQYGEMFDLTGCQLSLNGVHPKKGPWDDGVKAIEEFSNVYVDSSSYDPWNVGENYITIKAETDYGIAETQLELSVSQPVGEYILLDAETIPIYDSFDNGSERNSLKTGQTVNITECWKNMGRIGSGDRVGWVDVTMLRKDTDTTASVAGDINRDGYADSYDLALLGIYLNERSHLPEGVSSFTANEIAAADVDLNGSIDNEDLIALLEIIEND